MLLPKNYFLITLACILTLSPFGLTAQDFNTTRPDFGVFENFISTSSKSERDTKFSYDAKAQEYSLKTGENAQKADKTYAYTSIQGDFILRARVFRPNEAAFQLGWSIRNSLGANAERVNAFINQDGKTVISYTTSQGATTQKELSQDSLPDIIQLERRDSTYILSVAKWGKALKSIEITDSSLKNEVFAGIFLLNQSQNPVSANFSNVRIIKPMPEEKTAYKDYLGSTMEIMDVTTGRRKILFQSAHSLQAPNWVNNDEELVYNSNGYLYRYNFDSQRVNQINTGFATNNNNDHVFSFDQEILGISNHNPQDHNDSAIYLMDPQGDSLPRKITRDGVGNSYLHGISPDNKTLIFTGWRNKKFDLYAIDVNTREERQLTDTPGLDDGSEYSPDGKFIYFNSNRTGAMQLWRMKPDGSGQEQLTFDQKYNDWFPHISPDGKWIAFLSFDAAVPSGDHPFYKRCTLRLMPVSGGKPKIIAYIYGGQGTINTPSWSSDSKHIAFMTNSD